MRHRKATAMLAASLFLAFFESRQAFAQDEASQVDPAFVQLQNALKVDDKLTITSDNGNKVKGRLIEITDDQILLRVKNGQQSIAAPRIVKVGKRKNGVLLGAIIGAGASIPFALAVSTYAYNEGGSQASAFLIPVMMGLGIGTGIDALLPSTRTMYDRNSQRRVTVSPVIDRDRMGGRVTIKF
jgi:hypothetical protein